MNCGQCLFLFACVSAASHVEPIFLVAQLIPYYHSAISCLNVARGWVHYISHLRPSPSAGAMQISAQGMKGPVILGIVKHRSSWATSGTRRASQNKN